MILRILLRIGVTVLVLVAGSLQFQTARADDMSSYDWVHDPSMIRAGRIYYVFSTGDPAGVIGGGNIQIRTSTDLRHWQYTGTVFKVIPTWLTDEVLGVVNLWAPDISYFGGLYHLYYAGSTFGSNDSVIALATTPTLDQNSRAYHWTDQGVVLHSTSADDWNAIDPNLAVDAVGQTWLAFGSFWSGIKLRRIDSHTGKLAKQDTTLYSLADRPGSTAIEAASIVYRHPYYYLFVSFDRCCMGVDSTYRSMVGRAKEITGPYVDRSGHAMLAGGATQILASQGRFIGPAGGTVMLDGRRYLLVHHFYDGKDGGAAKLEINPLTWTASGWPVAGSPLSP